MRRSNPVPWLLVSAALAVAGPALAQSASKESPTSSKQGSAKSASAKAPATPRRLDFAPDRTVKETSTGRATGSDPQTTPAQATHGSGCHSQDGDA